MRGERCTQEGGARQYCVKYTRESDFESTPLCQPPTHRWCGPTSSVAVCASRLPRTQLLAPCGAIVKSIHLLQCRPPSRVGVRGCGACSQPVLT